MQVMIVTQAPAASSFWDNRDRESWFLKQMVKIRRSGIAGTYGVLADHEFLERVIQVSLTEPLLQHLEVRLASSLQQLLHQGPGCCIT